jgi:hypothetical protein
MLSLRPWDGVAVAGASGLTFTEHGPFMPMGTR